MSMDAVASEAGVTKPTVYRRWSSKADLATAALAELQGDERHPSTGSAASDLRVILSSLQRTLFRPDGLAIVGAVMVEERHTPELITLFRERVVHPRRAMLRQVLEEAEARGDLRPGRGHRRRGHDAHRLVLRPLPHGRQDASDLGPPDRRYGLEWNRQGGATASSRSPGVALGARGSCTSDLAYNTAMRADRLPRNAVPQPPAAGADPDHPALRTLFNNV